MNLKKQNEKLLILYLTDEFLIMVIRDKSNKSVTNCLYFTRNCTFGYVLLIR